MDWRRFKNIIIIVLVIINIFFCGVLIRIKINDGTVGNKTRENVISVLKEENIIMEENDFPKSRSGYSACYLSRILESDEGIINRIIGSKGRFSQKDEVFTFEISPDAPTAFEEKELISRSREFMDKQGIFSQLYKEDKVSTSKEKATVRFVLEYDECKFFDSYIEFSFNKKGIYKIEGRNIIKAEESVSSYEAELLPAESIIVAVAKDKKATEKIEVENITFGYYLGKSAGVYVSVLALPVWEIEFSDGDKLYYDARNGNLISM